MLDHLATDGIRVVTLRAEPEAIGLYERLGFQGCCRRLVAYLPETE